MYRNVEEALTQAYKLWGVCIEPQSNTAQVMSWMEHKGVRGASSGLTQHEWHANSAMIIKQVERILNRYELAAVELHYTGGVKADGIVDLVAFIECENKGVNLLICDALLMNIFNPDVYKATAVMDKFDIPNGTFYRQREKVKGIVAAIETSAYLKLDETFRESGVIG